MSSYVAMLNRQWTGEGPEHLILSGDEFRGLCGAELLDPLFARAALPHEADCPACRTEATATLAACWLVFLGAESLPLN